MEAPQDKYGQEHRMGTSRVEQTDRDHGGAGSSGSHGGAGSSGGPGSRNAYYPPKKISLVRGYQEPSGAKQTGQYKTRQESPPGPDRQDRTAHRNQKPSWAGLEAEASSGHDRVRGPHRVPQQPLPLRRQGGRRLEWPPWPQQKELPAPDESLWTRHDKIVKMLLWARQNRHNFLTWCGFLLQFNAEKTFHTVIKECQLALDYKLIFYYLTFIPRLRGGVRVAKHAHQLSLACSVNTLGRDPITSVTLTLRRT